MNIFLNSKSNFELEFRIRIHYLSFVSLNSHPLCTAFPSTHQKTTNKTPHRARQTKRPTNALERCKFRFDVYFSDNKSRWFFKKKGGGHSTHNVHCHLDPKQVKSSSATLDMNEYELVLEQLQTNIPIASIQALLQTRSETNLTYHQIAAIRRKAANTLVLGGDISSPAERLMRKLESDPDIHYVVYTAHHSMGNLITFSVSKKDRLGTSHAEVSDVGTDGDRASIFAESVMRGLSLQGGASLLLAAAWVSSEGRLYYDMFGEAMGFDITCGTNAEKRPLARGTLTTSDGKNVPFFNSFLPSQCAWVFCWLFVTAFPTLFPSASCQQTELIITDQDERCYTQIESSKTYSIFSNRMMHRLCKWHKVREHSNYDFELRIRITNSNFEIEIQIAKSAPPFQFVTGGSEL